ncbi:hypothetical protein L1987_21222 [Smallanthus sonchifolius]|uniref:Uncharacterized protein n=1 Tax=Smallanthus sonchifolius TaxID=185202 RepID=A0ACB9IUZ7_9ASTR|nr:hypothetical protein L1987_21222 [Smallanthus sonchifolius]
MGDVQVSSPKVIENTFATTPNVPYHDETLVKNVCWTNSEKSDRSKSTRNVFVPIKTDITINNQEDEKGMHSVIFKHNQESGPSYLNCKAETTDVEENKEQLANQVKDPDGEIQLIICKDDNQCCQGRYGLEPVKRYCSDSFCVVIHGTMSIYQGQLLHYYNCSIITHQVARDKLAFVNLAGSKQAPGTNSGQKLRDGAYMTQQDNLTSLEQTILEALGYVYEKISHNNLVQDEVTFVIVVVQAWVQNFRLF